MESKALETTEAECAQGRTAPRVSLDDIKNSIAAQYYISGDDAARMAKDGIGPQGSAISDVTPLTLLTICLIVMTNGFTIIGKSAPASPENYDFELGKKLAYEDAVRQIWPLMGFALRDRLDRDQNPGSYAK